MYLADYHTHSAASPDGSLTVNQLAEAAVRAGLDEICVTDHVDTVLWGSHAPREHFDWSGLLAQVPQAREQYAGRLTIRLGADIYLLRYEETGKPWWDGIGITTSSTAVFKGTFDGCGHTIDQMLAGSGGSGAALFLNTDGAAIQNLTVIGSAEASCCAAPTMAGSMPNSPGTPAALWAC